MIAVSEKGCTLHMKRKCLKLLKKERRNMIISKYSHVPPSWSAEALILESTRGLNCEDRQRQIDLRPLETNESRLQDKRSA